MRETFEELLEEGRDWLNAFDICLNGEDAQMVKLVEEILTLRRNCLLYTSPSPRDS